MRQASSHHMASLLSGGLADTRNNDSADLGARAMPCSGTGTDEKAGSGATVLVTAMAKQKGWPAVSPQRASVKYSRRK